MTNTHHACVCLCVCTMRAVADDGYFIELLGRSEEMLQELFLWESKQTQLSIAHWVKRERHE